MLLDAHLRAHHGVAAVGADPNSRSELALDTLVPESLFMCDSRDYLLFGHAAVLFGPRFVRFGVEQVAPCRDTRMHSGGLNPRISRRTEVERLSFRSSAAGWCHRRGKSSFRR